MASKYPPGASELAKAAIDLVHVAQRQEAFMEAVHRPMPDGGGRIEITAEVIPSGHTMTYVGPGYSGFGAVFPPVHEDAEGPMTAEGVRSGAVGSADISASRPGFAKFLDPRKLVPGGIAYVVVLRNADLPNGQKVCMTSGNIAVQVGHVIAKLAQESNWDVAESGIALLSVADSKDLVGLALALTNEGTAHVKYEDEGKLYGDGVKVFTALATHPIQKNASAALKKLRPWKCACNNDDRNERLGIRASKEVEAVRLAPPAFVLPGSKAAEQAGVNVRTPGTRDRDDLTPEQIKAQDGRRNG